MALSKIFELCIMRKVETQLITSDYQFGFKREHGTDLCIFTVKSVIKYYNLHNSPVYTCFLDASKLLKPMIVLTTGHCLENYSTGQFIFLLLECLCIGTQSKDMILGWELKCRHILLFLMEYDQEEYCPHRYLLYIWMISLHC